MRSAVLAGGFGLGVAVMAALLGIGDVILDQARAPELVGRRRRARRLAPAAASRTRRSCSPASGSGPLARRVLLLPRPPRMGTIYSARSARVRRRFGFVAVSRSLERALDDPEPNSARGVDRHRRRSRVEHAGSGARSCARSIAFIRIPDVPARAESWAEWLYFNGRAGSARFYLSFIAGPRLSSGRRPVAVRLQLERGGLMTSFSDAEEIDDATLLATAPDLTAKSNRAIERAEYRISIDLPAESGHGRAGGDIVIRAIPGRSLPPFSLRGAAGWVSGYTVPVMAAELDGEIRLTGLKAETIALRGGSAYHDHNWGFWEGVSWQWGQVQTASLSFVFGRVFPPRDAVDRGRLPGFLIALGADGPVGYATNVTIDETNDPVTHRPQRIVIRGEGQSVHVTLDLAINQTTATRMRAGGFGGGLDFLQLRGHYRVTGRAGERDIDATAPGSAETFRGEAR